MKKSTYQVDEGVPDMGKLLAVHRLLMAMSPGDPGPSNGLGAVARCEVPGSHGFLHVSDRPDASSTGPDR
ncbi:hypothetical protein GCM10009634_83660 [Saccharothrix xinjiangensis]